MDPVSQALLALAISRAGFNRLTRLATPMILVASLALDIDIFSYIGGARAYLMWRCTATHSIPGAVAIAAVVATLFTIAGRKHATMPIRFGRAFTVCLAGTLAHVAFDLCGSYGVKLLWPFSGRWFALGLIAMLDPWVLFVLLGGILVPALFRLITEEIGAKQKSRTAARGAIAALVLLAIYAGGREILYMRAIQMLESRFYRGEAPVSVGAFPESTNPFKWDGVVVTGAALLRVDVPVLGRGFDPFAAQVFFKPAESAALEAARATPSASLFLSFARFPYAHVANDDAGIHVEINDLRFSVHSPPTRAVRAEIDLSSQNQIVREKLEFAGNWWR
ncbi:MAG TPA: metal-dependent hydrolase [Candidatus Acidoferrum sp.]|nr:metal-dependent hydrolase [Candidatus Acidoferrum sp.]